MYTILLTDLRFQKYSSLWQISQKVSQRRTFGDFFKMDVFYVADARLRMLGHPALKQYD